MIVVRFKDKEEHTDTLKKVKKMKKFLEELEYMFEECYDDEEDYRDEYDEHEVRHDGRYAYRRGGGRRRM